MSAYLSPAEVPSVTNFRVKKVGDTYLTVAWDVSQNFNDCIHCVVRTVRLALVLVIAGTLLPPLTAASNIIHWSVWYIISEPDFLIHFNSDYILKCNTRVHNTKLAAWSQLQYSD